MIDIDVVKYNVQGIGFFAKMLQRYAAKYKERERKYFQGIFF